MKNLFRRARSKSRSRSVGRPTTARSRSRAKVDAEEVTEDTSNNSFGVKLKSTPKNQKPATTRDGQAVNLKAVPSSSQPTTLEEAKQAHKAKLAKNGLLDGPTTNGSNTSAADSATTTTTTSNSPERRQSLGAPSSPKRVVVVKKQAGGASPAAPSPKRVVVHRRRSTSSPGGTAGNNTSTSPWDVQLKKTTKVVKQPPTDSQLHTPALRSVPQLDEGGAEAASSEGASPDTPARTEENGSGVSASLETAAAVPPQPVARGRSRTNVSNRDDNATHGGHHSPRTKKIRRVVRRRPAGSAPASAANSPWDVNLKKTPAKATPEAGPAPTGPSLRSVGAAAANDASESSELVAGDALPNSGPAGEGSNPTAAPRKWGSRANRPPSTGPNNNSSGNHLARPRRNDAPDDNGSGNPWGVKLKTAPKNPKPAAPARGGGALSFLDEIKQLGERPGTTTSTGGGRGGTTTNKSPNGPPGQGGNARSPGTLNKPKPAPHKAVNKAPPPSRRVPSNKPAPAVPSRSFLDDIKALGERKKINGEGGGGGGGATGSPAKPKPQATRDSAAVPKNPGGLNKNPTQAPRKAVTKAPPPSRRVPAKPAPAVPDRSFLDDIKALGKKKRNCESGGGLNNTASPAKQKAQTARGSGAPSSPWRGPAKPFPPITARSPQRGGSPRDSNEASSLGNSNPWGVQLKKTPAMAPKEVSHFELDTPDLHETPVGAPREVAHFHLDAPDLHHTEARAPSEFGGSHLDTPALRSAAPRGGGAGDGLGDDDGHGSPSGGNGSSPYGIDNSSNPGSNSSSALGAEEGADSPKARQGYRPNRNKEGTSDSSPASRFQRGKGRLGGTDESGNAWDVSLKKTKPKTSSMDSAGPDSPSLRSMRPSGVSAQGDDFEDGNDGAGPNGELPQADNKAGSGRPGMLHGRSSDDPSSDDYHSNDLYPRFPASEGKDDHGNNQRSRNPHQGSDTSTLGANTGRPSGQISGIAGDGSSNGSENDEDHHGDTQPSGRPLGGSGNGHGGYGDGSEGGDAKKSGGPSTKPNSSNNGAAQGRFPKRGKPRNNDPAEGADSPWDVQLKKASRNPNHSSESGFETPSLRSVTPRQQNSNAGPCDDDLNGPLGPDEDGQKYDGNNFSANRFDSDDSESTEDSDDSGQQVRGGYSPRMTGNDQDDPAPAARSLRGKGRVDDAADSASPWDVNLNKAPTRTPKQSTDSQPNKTSLRSAVPLASSQAADRGEPDGTFAPRGGKAVDQNNDNSSRPSTSAASNAGGPNGVESPRVLKKNGNRKGKADDPAGNDGNPWDVDLKKAPKASKRSKDSRLDTPPLRSVDVRQQDAAGDDDADNTTLGPDDDWEMLLGGVKKGTSRPDEGSQDQNDVDKEDKPRAHNGYKPSKEGENSDTSSPVSRFPRGNEKHDPAEAGSPWDVNLKKGQGKKAKDAGAGPDYSTLRSVPLSSPQEDPHGDDIQTDNEAVGVDGDEPEFDARVASRPDIFRGASFDDTSDDNDGEEEAKLRRGGRRPKDDDSDDDPEFDARVASRPETFRGASFDDTSGDGEEEAKPRRGGRRSIDNNSGDDKDSDDDEDDMPQSRLRRQAKLEEPKASDDPWNVNLKNTPNLGAHNADADPDGPSLRAVPPLAPSSSRPSMFRGGSFDETTSEEEDAGEDHPRRAGRRPNPSNTQPETPDDPSTLKKIDVRLGGRNDPEDFDIDLDKPKSSIMGDDPKKKLVPTAAKGPNGRNPAKTSQLGRNHQHDASDSDSDESDSSDSDNDRKKRNNQNVKGIRPRGDNDPDRKKQNADKRRLRGRASRQEDSSDDSDSDNDGGKKYSRRGYAKDSGNKSEAAPRTTDDSSSESDSDDNIKAQAKYRSRIHSYTVEEANARRERCYMWYARLGQPDKAKMKRLVAGLPPSCDIVVDDVDLLPWVWGGTWCDVKGMTALITDDLEAIKAQLLRQ